MLQQDILNACGDVDCCLQVSVFLEMAGSCREPLQLSAQPTLTSKLSTTDNRSGE
jgi:hypothetical protein